MPQEILAVIGLFLCILVLGGTYMKNRHRERLALIQYGKDSTVFRKPYKNSALKFGLLLLSVGMGILVGSMLDGIFNSEPKCTFSCIFMFGGMSLLYYHQYIGSRQHNDYHETKAKTFMEDDDELI
jgi:hypothetical protein